MQGTIIKIISNLYTVKTSTKTIECRARGKFRKESITPLVGDTCLIDEENKYILEIYPRKNELERPMIANIDAALIVTSVKLPDLSLNLLDKMISIITLKNIEPILCFSKLDLVTKEEQKRLDNIMNYYKNIGYTVIKNTELSELKKVLKGKIIVITGQTGAGKSTLLNSLNPNLNLKTDEISLSLGRGKHTTRHVEMFDFEDFFIADTPGFSSLDFRDFTKEEIKSSFIEFKNYPCKFKDCMHDKEQICNVKKAVEENQILNSRYQNYLAFLKVR